MSNISLSWKKFPIYLQLHPLSFLTECPPYNSVNEISLNTIFGEAEDTTFGPFSAFTLKNQLDPWIFARWHSIENIFPWTELTWRLTWTSGVPWWWGSQGRRWPRPGSGQTFSPRPPPEAASVWAFTIVMIHDRYPHLRHWPTRLPTASKRFAQWLLKLQFRK